MKGYQRWRVVPSIRPPTPGGCSAGGMLCTSVHLRDERNASQIHALRGPGKIREGVRPKSAKPRTWRTGHEPTVGQWVTVRKTRDIYICRGRVPLSEVYSSISENFHLVHTNGIGQSCVEVNANIQHG